MQIVSFTTSVNYTDYLDWCLRSLSRVVDKIFVVTERHDSAFDACQRYDAIALPFDKWHENGAVFNKAGAVRYVQELLYREYPEAWYLAIDADVVMGENARRIIEQGAQDPAAIYSARRVDFHTMDALRSGTPSKVYGSMFAGYFQFYRRHLYYSEWSRSAEGCDLAFVRQFSACSILPLTVAHLGREQINWEGRKSPLW